MNTSTTPNRKKEKYWMKKIERKKKRDNFGRKN